MGRSVPCIGNLIPVSNRSRDSCKKLWYLGLLFRIIVIAVLVDLHTLHSWEEGAVEKASLSRKRAKCLGICLEVMGMFACGCVGDLCVYLNPFEFDNGGKPFRQVSAILGTFLFQYYVLCLDPLLSGTYRFRQESAFVFARDTCMTT